MLIFVEGANCRCLHFCFLIVNVLNLFFVQVSCTWTEFEVVALQCNKVWSRMVNQNSSDLKVIVFSLILQRWSRGHKARGQGHKKNPRPRTAFPRTDTLEAKDRNARGQGQGPRTQAQVLSKKKKKKVFTNIFQAISKKKKKGLHKNFSGDLQKKKKKKKVFTKIFRAISTKTRFPKNFSSAPQNFNNSKTSQDRPVFEDLRPRGQGLQNLSSRTPPLSFCWTDLS